MTPRPFSAGTPAGPPGTPAGKRLSDRAVAALLLDSRPWLSCEECFDLLDVHAEAVVDQRPTNKALLVHLDACPACAEEAGSMVALVTDSATQWLRPG